MSEWLQEKTLPAFVRYFHTLALRGCADITRGHFAAFYVTATDRRTAPQDLSEVAEVWLIYKKKKLVH